MTAPGDRWVCDERLGETIYGRFSEAGNLNSLIYIRFDDVERRAGLGDVFAARAAKFAPGVGGVFLDLGLGERGDAGFRVLRAGRKPPVEGSLVAMQVIREARDGKAAVLAPATDYALAASDVRPRRVRSADLPQATSATSEEQATIAEAIETALSDAHPIPSGGMLWLQSTRALTAVDIDASDRPLKGSDAARFGPLCRDAIRELARLISVQSIGGRVVIDLPGPRNGEMEKDLHARLRALGVAAEPMGYTRSGLLEVVVVHTRTPLRERLCGTCRSPTLETRSLRALQALHAAAKAERGRRLRLVAPEPIFGWLKNEGHTLLDALTQEVGARYDLVIENVAKPIVEVLP
jgi:hypothetical protein